MPLPQRYNRVLRRHTLHFAAWSPISDPYAVGDYGLLRNGVFQKLGHIRDFGVDFGTEQGHPVAFDFSSTQVSTVRMQADVEVPVFQNVDVAATLTFQFEGDFLALVKSPVVNVEIMRSTQAVARRLDATPGWKHRYRVVWKVYSGAPALIVSSLGRGTKVELAGRASALRKFELGDSMVGVRVTSQHDLKIEGAAGPIALDLFRVRQSGALAAAPLLGGLVDREELEDLVDGSEDWTSDSDDRDQA